MSAPKLDLSKLRHDLRVPINQIIGYSELLAEEPGIPEAFRPDLERIRLGGQELLCVIAEYLDDTRFIEKRRHTDQVNHDLRTPVNHIRGYAEMLEELAAESGRADLVPDLQRIQHAATNWLDLMEAYLLPGEIKPEDTSVILRVVPGMVIRTPSARSAETEALTGPARIVVVDDDEANRDLLSRRLGRQGYQVQTATGGLEALGLIRRERPDLVLLDLILPGL